MNKETN